MSELTLTPIRLSNGLWEAEISGANGKAPKIVATHQGQDVEGVMVTEEDNGLFHVHVPVPIEALSDGVQTVLVQDKSSGDTLGKFAFCAGAPLAEDLRAEVDLLRAELDMLKRAFRRHCVETGA